MEAHHQEQCPKLVCHVAWVCPWSIGLCAGYEGTGVYSGGKCYILNSEPCDEDAHLDALRAVICQLLDGKVCSHNPPHGTHQPHGTPQTR